MLKLTCFFFFFFFFQGSLSLTENTQITKNNAYSGGGIYILNGTINFSGLHEFYENSATYGGAIGFFLFYFYIYIYIYIYIY